MSPLLLFAERGRWSAAGTGLLVPLAFAPFGWYPLAIGLIALLMWLCTNCSSREAAWRGFCFGFTAFLAGSYWLYTSIHGFGGAPVAVALVLMVGLFALMASYFALTAAAASYFSRLSTFLRWCIVWPALFALFEWLRGFLFTGFPWLTWGYGQIDGPLGAWAPVAGVHGVSLFTLLLAGAALTLICGDRAARIAAGALAAGIVIATVAVQDIGWTRPADRVLSIGMVQGSISQDLKWRSEQLRPTMALYRELTFEQPAELVIWPEVAIPSFAASVRDYLDEVGAEARRLDMQIYLGILTYDFERQQYRNSLIGLGNHTDMYHKRHLVPFGEFFPVPEFARRWMRGAGLPNQDTLAGDENQPPLRFDDLFLAPTICYEDAYGAEQLGFFPQANMLINVSNDAWFGDSIAPHQHLQIARMRARETGRYMLRSTNTGITAIIGADGRILARSPQFETHVLSGEVRPYSGATPYTRFGNRPVLMLCGALLVSAWLVRRRTAPVG